MALLETAAEYILGILVQNEEVKKFPKEFLDESVNWVKSWFLTPEDPTSTKILSNPEKTESSKKDIIEAKLEDLQNNATFMKELEAKLQVYSIHKARIKNVLDNVDVKTKDDIHIGDKIASLNDNYDEKNVVKGGKIETEGGFRLGDG
jgi:hypothetical protein